MGDYSDYKVWRDDELRPEDVEYFQEHEEYTPEDVYEMCKLLIKTAQDKGLKGCYLKFSSHMEAYEDSLSNPSVTACGYRKLNQKEVQEQEKHDRIAAKATELGITFYEAGILMQLQDRGVI